MTDLQPGDRAYWFNTIALKDRPVSVVKVLKRRYVVQTEDGHCYSPCKSMVSRKRTDLS